VNRISGHRSAQIIPQSARARGSISLPAPDRAAGASVNRFEQEVLLKTGDAYLMQPDWTTAGLPPGSYQALGYLEYESRQVGLKTAAFRAGLAVWLPLVLRQARPRRSTLERPDHPPPSGTASKRSRMAASPAGFLPRPIVEWRAGWPVHPGDQTSGHRSDQMRAVVFYQHGGPEVLACRADIPAPQPGPDEVLIRVRYAALNRLDNFVRIGWRGLDLQFPHILGSDFSGAIEGVGANVPGWHVGQRVVANPTLWCGRCPQCLAGWHNRCDSFAILGEHVPGAYAEFVRVPARNLVAIPDGCPDDMAAAAPLVSVTAWHMLVTAGRVRPGETVLVVGAGGGVNSVAIQIAKLAGATVGVVAANAEKAGRARSLGADWTVDRSAEANWSKAVYAVTDRRGVDVVVDNVGAATWGSSLRSLARGGRLLTVGGTAGYEAVTPVNLMFGKHLSVIGSTMGTQADFEAVMAQVWAGKIAPVVDRIFPLADYPAALARLMAGEAFGKILVQVA
jgi:NADPH:quinone reductase-like Zn-dependent oxidoreductase